MLDFLELIVDMIELLLDIIGELLYNAGRRALGRMVLVLLLILIWLFSLLGCKPKATVTAPAVRRSASVDTVRQRLKIHLQGSQNELEIIQNNTKTTIKHYETADSAYSAITVDLQ